MIDKYFDEEGFLLSFVDELFEVSAIGKIERDMIRNYIKTGDIYLESNEVK